MGAIKSKVFGETQDEDIKNNQADAEAVSINCKEPTNTSFTSSLSNSPETTTYLIVRNDNDDNLVQKVTVSEKTNSKTSSHHFPLLDFAKLESKHQQKIRPYALFDQSNPKKKKENSNKENKMDAVGPAVTSFQPPNHLQKSQYFRSFRMASRRIFNPNMKKLNEQTNENKNLFKSSDHISAAHQDATNKETVIINNTTNSAATNAFSNNNAITNAQSNLNSYDKIETNIVNLDKNLDNNLETDLIVRNETSILEKKLDISQHRDLTQQAHQNTSNLKSKSTIDFTKSGSSNPHSCLQTSATSTKLTVTNSHSTQSHNYSKTPSIQNKSFRNHNFNSSSYFSSIRRRFTSNSNQFNNKNSINSSFSSSNNENSNTNVNPTDIVNNEKIKLQEDESEMLSAIDPRKFRSTSIVETFSDKISSLTGFGSNSTSFIRSESNLPFLSFSNVTSPNNQNSNTNPSNTISSSNILSSVPNTTSTTKINTNTDTVTSTATTNTTENEAPRNSESNPDSSSSISSTVNTVSNTTNQSTNSIRSASVNEMSKSSLKNLNRESVTSSSTDWEALTENQNKNENLINDLKKQIDSLNKQLEHLGREDSKIINELSEKIENLAKMNVNIITAIGTQQENKFRASFFGRPRQPSQTSEAYYARLKQQNEMLLLQQRQIEQLRKDLLSSFVSSQTQTPTPQPTISQNTTFVYPETSYYNNQNYNGYSRPTMSSTYASYPTSPYPNSTYYFSSTPNQATPTPMPSTPTMTSPTFSGTSPFVSNGYSGNGSFYMNRNGSYSVEGNQYFYYPTASQTFQRTTLNNVNPNGIFYDPNSGQYFQYQRPANLSQAQYFYNQNLNGIYANIYAYRKAQAQSQQNMNDTSNTNSSFEDSNRGSEQSNVIITEVASDDEELDLNSKFNSKKDYVDAISLNEEEI